MTQRNFYDVLGVLPGASADELRTVYVRLVKLHHPDTAGNLPGRLQEVQRAYHCLADVELRARHDRLLASERRIHAKRQQRIEQRLRRYDRRHPATARARGGLLQGWRPLLLWSAAVVAVVGLLVELLS